jgi:ribonuclease HI
MSDDPVIMYTDGASRGNPGLAGGGVYICDQDGNEISSLKQYFGETTNNQAEYRAFLMGLEEAKRLGVRNMEIRADSELLVRQINGQYRVKDPNIKPLFERAKALLAQGFSSVQVRHILRGENKKADQLANEAIDER